MLKSVASSAIALTLSMGSLPPWSPVSPDVAEVMEHLEALQSIADVHGNRAAGSDGYDASLKYVQEQLEAAGIESTVQAFSYDRWFTSANTLELVSPESVPVQSIPVFGAPATPQGGLKGKLAAPAANGCQKDEWGEVEGDFIALIELAPDICDPETHAQIAADAGATAVIVYAPVEGNTIVQIDPEKGSIPMTSGYGTTMADWRDRLSTEDLTALIDAAIGQETVETANLLADINTDAPGPIDMFGAHLDGVASSPGINDNASAAAALLAAALKYASDPSLAPTRVAFWGGEEDGLRGSTHYVNSLSDAELERIGEYSNFEMIGSPNYIINARPASGSDSNAPTQRIRDYFDAIGQAHVAAGPFGGSDFQPFVDAGIPSLDFSTGAGANKTAEQAALFGGEAGKPYDPNYHSPADNLENVSYEALSITVAAINHVFRNRGDGR